jgi:ABC-2 type transport system ATP-binding protein
MHGPKLLVLDEPMNGLDPLGMADLRDLLRGLGRTRGVTILISSHLLHEVEQICDRVLFIRDGRLLTEATLTSEMLAQFESVGLRTTDDGRTRELLTREAFVREIALSAEGLECHLAAEDVPRIAPVLVGAGIGIRAITPRRRSLEDVYLSHYAGRKEGGIE